MEGKNVSNVGIEFHLEGRRLEEISKKEDEP
jgi:hypothetical protein